MLQGGEPSLCNTLPISHSMYVLNFQLMFLCLVQTAAGTGHLHVVHSERTQQEMKRCSDSLSDCSTNTASLSCDIISTAAECAVHATTTAVTAVSTTVETTNGTSLSTSAEGTVLHAGLPLVPLLLLLQPRVL